MLVQFSEYFTCLQEDGAMLKSARRSHTVFMCKQLDDRAERGIP